MYVTYACHKCEATVANAFDEASTELTCPRCAQAVAILPGSIREGKIHRCLACPSEELYVRKDFPQQLGIAVVIVAIVLSSVAWYYRQVALTYGILFVSALIDFALWVSMGNLLQCYRCQAQYRGLASLDEHDGFDLEVHEKHRQQLIRLSEAEQAASQRGHAQ